MAIEQRYGGHRVSQQPAPKSVEVVREEVRREGCVFQVQAIAVELLDAGSGDDYAGGVAGFEDV